MNSALNILLIVLSCLITTPLWACIWQGGENAYWPSNRIEVCFLEANPNDLEHEQAFSAAIELATQAYVEMSQQTDFHFFGFQTCVFNEDSELTPMIRVDFSTEVTLGHAVSKGPGASTEPINIVMPYLDRSGKDDNPQGVQTDFAIKYIMIHETLHLLGFSHDSPRDPIKDTNRFPPHTLIVGDFDPLSVMHLFSPMGIAAQTNQQNPTTNPILSSGDISCLNQVARRTIDSSSSVPSQPESD